jgi:uncharacterized protein YcbK (DUF882 family)
MIFNKKDTGNLCDGLSKKEMACKCNNAECNCTIVSDELIKCYTAFRKKLGVPLKILSGYRCIIHNYDLVEEAKQYKKDHPTYKITSEPAKLSRHITGEAIDISMKGLKKTPDELKKIALLCGFNYCYYDIIKNFLHVDCR